MTELQLLHGLRQGQAKATADWFKTYSPKIQAFVASKVDSLADAEEITQETFLHCLQQLGLFRGESGLLTWMISVARHEVADYYRKKYAKKAIQTSPLSELVAQPVTDAHQTAELVKFTLKQLPVQYQELLQMKYIDGLSVAEIARQLKRSLKAIESELFRARQAFKTAYQAAYQVTYG